MADITLVTPPDILVRNELSILLFYPSNRIQDQFENILYNLDVPCTVYIYNPPAEIIDPDWLVTMFHSCDYAILDCDNAPPEERDMLSYFIGYNKTFWLTNGANPYYNKISNNRIYDLEILKQKIGGNFEKQQQTPKD